MDVRCERCGTEYEFEDAQVTEAGVTVKCTNCGHLFKIRKKSFVLTESIPPGEQETAPHEQAQWMVRRLDGTLLSFNELTTLQKWIVERKVSRDDEISKKGDAWKALGEITELASFFHVVEQASSGGEPAPLALGSGDIEPLPADATPLIAQVPPLAIAPDPAAIPPVAIAPDPAAIPPVAIAPDPAAIPPVAIAPDPAPAPPVAVAPAPAPAPPAALPPVPAAAPEMAVVPPPAVEPTPAPVVAEAESAPMQFGEPAADLGDEPDSWGGMELDDADDVVEKWKKRGRRKWFVLIPILLLLASVGAWFVLAPASFHQVLAMALGRAVTISEEARGRFENGQAHFLKDSTTELDAAVEDLRAAVALADGKFPLAQAVLAEVHITRADKSQDRIERIDAARAKGQAAPIGERNQWVSAARAELDEAERLIDGASQSDPKSLAPKRAFANLVRVRSGDRSRLEGALAEAASVAKDDPQLLYIDGASLAAEENTRVASLEPLHRALALKPDLVRARFRLAAT